MKVVEVGGCNPAELRNLVREKFDLEPDYRWLRCHSEASGVSLAYFLERARAIHEIPADSSNHEGKGRDVITKGLALHIPRGYIQPCQHYPLSEISAG